jgi:hypothetical protein
MECQRCGGYWVSPQNLDLVIGERDQALEKIRLAVNALKHHHMSRPGIAAIVRLLSENTEARDRSGSGTSPSLNDSEL